MAFSVDVEGVLPCIELPELPEIPTIDLIGGLSLSGFLDLSAGMTDDCTVNANLMAQLAPALASLGIIVKILAVLKGLEAAAKSAFLDAGDLISALVDLAGLFASLTPAGIGITVVGCLRLIISFLNCFIGQLEAVVEVQAQIAEIRAQVDADPGSASVGLLASLDCAEANISLQMDHAMASMGPLEPLIMLVSTLASFVGISLDFSIDMSAAESLQDVVDTMQTAIGTLEDIIQSIPV
jgi:hypothetical protein